MQLSNNRVDRALFRHLLLPNEDLSIGNGLYLVELWNKELPRETPMNTGCWKNYMLLSTN